MVTEETLERFLQHTATIIELAQSIGFTNIRLLTPAMPEQKDALHLLADDLPNKMTSIFDNAILAHQIRGLVSCSVCVVSEPQIHRILRERMLADPVPIIELQRVETLFRTKLIPFSRNGEYEEEDAGNWLSYRAS